PTPYWLPSYRPPPARWMITSKAGSSVIPSPSSSSRRDWKASQASARASNGSLRPRRPRGKPRKLREMADETPVPLHAECGILVSYNVDVFWHWMEHGPVLVSGRGAVDAGQLLPGFRAPGRCGYPVFYTDDEGDDRFGPDHDLGRVAEGDALGSHRS